MATAGKAIYDWAKAFPNSFPPIVINITDGLATDSPHQGVDLAGWATRLASITTLDGPTLIFNIFLSPSGSMVSFPSSPVGLPEPGPDFFAISSKLPELAIINARSAGIAVSEGARGLVLNADATSLAAFLRIFTGGGIGQG